MATTVLLSEVSRDVLRDVLRDSTADTSAVEFESTGLYAPVVNRSGAVGSMHIDDSAVTLAIDMPSGDGDIVIMTWTHSVDAIGSVKQLLDRAYASALDALSRASTLRKCMIGLCGTIYRDIEQVNVGCRPGFADARIREILKSTYFAS